MNLHWEKIQVVKKKWGHISYLKQLTSPAQTHHKAPKIQAQPAIEFGQTKPSPAQLGLVPVKQERIRFE